MNCNEGLLDLITPRVATKGGAYTHPELGEFKAGWFLRKRLAADWALADFVWWPSDDPVPALPAPLADAGVRVVALVSLTGKQDLRLVLDSYRALNAVRAYSSLLPANVPRHPF